MHEEHDAAERHERHGRKLIADVAHHPCRRVELWGGWLLDCPRDGDIAGHDPFARRNKGQDNGRQEKRQPGDQPARGLMLGR